MMSNCKRIDKDRQHRSISSKIIVLLLSIVIVLLSRSSFSKNVRRPKRVSFSLVSDLDHDSRHPDKLYTWRSVLKRGTLIPLENSSKYTIRFETNSGTSRQLHARPVRPRPTHKQNHSLADISNCNKR